MCYAPSIAFREALSRSRRPPHPDPALHATLEREGRTVHPDPRHRMGTRPRLAQHHRTRPRPVIVHPLLRPRGALRSRVRTVPTRRLRWPSTEPAASGRARRRARALGGRAAARAVRAAARASARCTGRSQITEYPEEAGFWSVTTRRRRPRRSAATGRPTRPSARHHGADRRDHAARADRGDVHRDGPAEARPAQGAVPARLHAEADRRARGRDPRDHGRRARPPRRAARRATSSPTSPSRSSRA